jgi:NodT family efflux transporter outer membrane factor (OMF) lipoprotein
MDSVKRIGVFGFMVLPLLSCMMGPNYTRPKVGVPSQYKEAPKAKQQQKWKKIEPQDTISRGEWWRIFHDSVLDDLEQQLNQHNQNIVQAEANYRQSLALVEQARAGLFPTLSGVASLFRQKQGGGTTTFLSTSGGDTTTNIGTSNTTSIRSPTNTSYSSVLYATWEPDLWGMVRRTIEANTAAAQSNEALVAVTRLSAQSALAQYYFELRTLDLNQRNLEQSVSAYQGILKFTHNQYSAGVADRAAVVQAQVQLESAQSLAVNNGILRGQYEHAIAVLMGLPPANAFIKSEFAPLRVPNIPLTVPSTLLERRPDIAQSERLVQNSSALIGVAIAAFYPNLALTGSASATARSLHQLIHTPAIGWSTGLQLAETFVDGGFRKARVHAAQAYYEAQIAAYRQVVLAAFQDVEDNLIALRLLREQSKIQQQAASHAQYAFQLMSNQYKAGTVALSDVLLAQIQAYQAQKTANEVAGLQLSAAVGLIKALGGSWDTNLVN